MPAPPTAALVGAGVSLAALHAGPSVVRLVPRADLVLPRLHGVGEPGRLALTFDDGPDPRSTPAFLELLARLDWKATFFMLGRMVRSAPGLAAEVTAAGHEVGVHGYDHRSHLRMPPRAVAEDMERGLECVAEVTGASPVWFRPPFGALSGGTLLACRRLGLRLVLWTAWGRDWRAEATPASVMADIDRGLVPGGTVVLHDSDCTSAPGAWRSGLGSLPLLADRAEALGWRVGPLADHGIAR